MRRKIGRLPDAGGATKGQIRERHGKRETSRFRRINCRRSRRTNARNRALPGQFAQFLSEKIGKSVEWQVIGRNGITVKETIHELVPKIPDEKFDYILLALCGNDVLKLRSPRIFRRDMKKLLAILQRKKSGSDIFYDQCAGRSSVARFAVFDKIHSRSSFRFARRERAEFTAEMEKVFYFHQPTNVPDRFFADGIHPSEKGYAVWSKRMIEFFEEKYKW